MLTSEYLLAAVVLAIVAWVVVIFYRVIREQLIFKVDFWKANWKIVLFWFVVAALALGVWYVIKRYNLGQYLPKQ